MRIHPRGGCDVRTLSEPIPLKVGLQIPCGFHSQTTTEAAVRTDATPIGTNLPRVGSAEGMDSVGINRHGVTNEKVVEKGIANHLESESCEGVREDALEALTGTYAGGAIELRNCQSGGRRSHSIRKAKRRCALMASASSPGGVVAAQACIETPCARTERPRCRLRWIRGRPMGESDEP
jgi:hypothetical protein